MELISPEYDKYKKILQRDPRSKVFAFLADIYRKYTMMEDALDILEKGIRYNPDYIPGYLILARCYYDQGHCERCYSTLKPLVNTNGDNLRLQILFSQVCEELEFWEEALDAHKRLRYLDPKNMIWSERIAFLEKKLSPEFQKQTLFHEEKLSNFPNAIDEWAELNFADSDKKKTVDEQNSLMDIYDRQFGSTDSREDKLASVKKGLNNFHGALNKRASSLLMR